MEIHEGLYEPHIGIEHGGQEKALKKILRLHRDPVRVKNYILTHRLVPSIKIIRLAVSKCYINSIDILLDALIDKSSLSTQFPEMAVRLLYANLMKRLQVPQFTVIKRLLFEFQFDFNYVEIRIGSILHMLCHFVHGQEEACDFLQDLLDRGVTINIDIETRKRRRTRDQFFMSTPLQYAIEKGCYKLALFFIKHKASVDHLVFDKYSWRVNVRISDKADYMNLIKALVYLNVLTLEKVYNSFNVTKADKIHLNSFFASRSLVELCLRVIRKTYYSSDGQGNMDDFICQLEEQILVDPKIISFVNLDHL